MKRSLARGCIGALVTLPAMMLGCSSNSAGSSPVAQPASTSSPAPVPAVAAAASLASLTIDGLAMTPAFSPDIHDYAMRCSAGTNTVGVTATPTGGATAELIRPTATPLTAAQTANVDLLENDAVVVEARGGDGSTSQYWVRCLPHDFPHVSIARYASTTPGYYLLGNTIISNTSAESAYEMILDANGTPVWYYLAPAGYLAPVAKNVVAFPTAGGTFGTDPNGHYRIFHLDTGEETSVRTVGSAMVGHEFLPLPNGNTMLFSYPKSSGFDLSSRGVTTTDIADCAIQEIAPDGSLVWSWLGSDHIDPVTESTDLVAATIGTTPVIDAFHCNSIERTPSGDLLVSARHLDAVFLVSRATGKILWKLGGVPQNKDGAQILELQDDPRDRVLSPARRAPPRQRQHHALRRSSDGERPGARDGDRVRHDRRDGARRLAVSGAVEQRRDGQLPTVRRRIERRRVGALPRERSGAGAQ